MNDTLEKLDETQTVVGLKRAAGHRKKAASARSNAAAKHKGGRPLADAVANRMTVTGELLTAASVEMGISAGYLSRLLRGLSFFSLAKPSVVAAAAAYLGISLDEAYVLAEQKNNSGVESLTALATQ